MLNNMSFSHGGVHPIPQERYTSRIQVYRPSDPTQVGQTPQFSGRGGTVVTKYRRIVSGYPALILPLAPGTLGYQSPGEQEVAPYRLFCPYKKRSDGTLVVIERDLIIDVWSDNNRPQVYEAIYSRDPANTHAEIVVDVRFGTIDLNTLRENSVP